MRSIRDETFNGTFPFAPRYLDLDCFAMHYVDEGSGDPIVLVVEPVHELHSTYPPVAHRLQN